MQEIIFLYVTAPDRIIAAAIAQTLVEEKLAACVNIHGPMQSVYTWDGAIEQSDETPLFVKTIKAAAARARDRIIELHPHDTPCVAALPVAGEGSNAAFLEWIAKTTKP